MMMKMMKIFFFSSSREEDDDYHFYLEWNYSRKEKEEENSLVTRVLASQIRIKIYYCLHSVAVVQY